MNRPGPSGVLPQRLARAFAGAVQAARAAALAATAATLATGTPAVATVAAALLPACAPLPASRSAPSAPSAPSSLPAPAEILAELRLANSYFMREWPDPGLDIVTDRARPSNIWTRAVYYEGLMALYALDPRPGYYEYAVAWGDAHDWQLGDGSRLLRNADFQAAGQTYIDLYRIDPDPVRVAAIKAAVDAMLATDQIDDWNWIDAIQMAMPVFAKLGVLYDDDAYLERMIEMYRFTRDEHGDNGLFNPADGLWWRDGDYDPPYTSPAGRNVYWSRGNGWVIMGLARVLDTIPAATPGRDLLLADFTAMARALVPLQRDDGFWNVSLVDPSQYGGPETSGTAMFTFSLAWGINHGILDAATFEPVVVRAWRSLAEDALHPDGFLGYVQSTGANPSAGQPVTYDRKPDFEDYALGAFLLAGTEVYRLTR